MNASFWALAALAASIASAAPGGDVRVWQDSIQLPTYAERDPDPVPQFAAFFTDGPANYPYPIRSGITKLPQDRAPVVWRTLNLENEYLFCRILPDLGGHVYNCRDKIANKEVFYTNPVIKKDMIGKRGAWIATGIEPNFPVAHSRETTSPVSFAIRQEPGGAASAAVGGTDRVTGMQWRIEYRLRPGAAVLEERVSFYNPTSVRRPYQWWNNAEIEWDDPGIRFIFPTKLVQSHNAATIESWPVDTKGVDRSVVANDPEETAWFAYSSREPFMAVYKPRSKSGVAHYADAGVVPGKKMYFFGRADVEDYRRRLTDNFNVHVEMQAGLFTDQETFEFLAPQQSRTFTEYWIPFRDLNGVTRATPEMVLFAARHEESPGKPRLTVELAATRAIAGARIRISNSGKDVSDTSADLDPKTPWTITVDAASPQPFAIQVLDGKGSVLLEHTEGFYDASVPPGVRTGPQKLPDWNGPETESLLVKRETYNELSGLSALAQNDTEAGLAHFAGNVEFERNAARLDLANLRFSESAAHAARVLAAASEDEEAFYYAGVAQSRMGHDDRARLFLSRVAGASPFEPAARFELALIAARARDYPNAVTLLDPLAADPARGPRIAALQAALLRRSSDSRGAREKFDQGRALAPENALLRYEGTLAGVDDPALWSYLAEDSERILDLVEEYIRLGFWEDASALLKLDESRGKAQFTEPGAVPPRRSALIAYYRAFAENALKGDPAEALKTGAGLPTRYMFPNRETSLAVIQFALDRNPSDATAHALLGNLELYSFQIEAAVKEWEKAVSLNPKLAVERQILPKAIALSKRAITAATELSKGAADSAKAAPPLPPPPPKPSTSNVNPGGANPGGHSATELAAEALLLAAAGSPGPAAAQFRAEAFASQKQPIEVRQAYIEVQLQDLLQLAETGKCDMARDKLFKLGDADPSLDFTLYGFGRQMETAHFLYYLGTAEANCSRTKEARKYWTRAAKIKNPPSSPDFGYSFLAASRLDAAGGKASASEALKTLGPATGPGADIRQLNEAILLSAAQQTGPAQAQLLSVAQQSSDKFAVYLATVELARKTLSPQQ